VSERSRSRVTQLTVDLTDPDARTFERPEGIWYLLGRQQIRQQHLDRLQESGDGAEFCRLYRGALVMQVDLADGSATRMRAWRGLFSHAELYYSSGATGEVVLTDHIRNVIARLPLSDRYPSDDGIAEHFLFRRPYGNTSYSAHVTRLGNAEHVEIDLDSGKREAAVFDRIAAVPTERSTDEYLEMMGGKLEASLVAVKGDDSALFFSGGVDSTLLMSYVPADAQPFTFVADTAEFCAETDYARNAAALLGVSLNEVPMPEEEFLRMMETATEIQGAPCFDDAVPYLTRLIVEQPMGQLVLGHGADSAFGMSLKLARFSSWFRHPLVLQPLRAVADKMPGHFGYRMRQVVPIAEGFGRSLHDPFGYAGGIRTSGKTPLLEKALGKDVIDAAPQRELDYALARVELTVDPKDSFWAHLELAHWLVTFNNPIATNLAVANSVGRRIVGPYCDPDVLTALATIPVYDRYVRRLSAKWLLKELLVRRVPEYPVGQRKKSTAFPWRRFYTDGPLTHFWESYPVPDMFDGDLRNELVAEPMVNTWTAMSYAVWLERVVRNSRLEPHPATVGNVHRVDRVG
jgi:asparagine synthetase B (glutamine-hydrolysing)